MMSGHRLLPGKVWIVRCLFGVVLRYDRIVAGRIHHGLCVGGMLGRWSRSSRHGHWHRHLLQVLSLLLGRIRLRGIATGGRVIPWHGHGLRHCLGWPRLVHRVDSRTGGVLLHDDPSLSRSRRPRRICTDVHRIGSDVVLGRCDHYWGSNHSTLVSPSPTAHPAQREEHKQDEKYNDRNEDIHLIVVVFRWNWKVFRICPLARITEAK